MTEKNNNKIPSGYRKEDIEKRLTWLEKMSGFSFDPGLENNPEDLKGMSLFN